MHGLLNTRTGGRTNIQVRKHLMKIYEWRKCCQLSLIPSLLDLFNAHKIDVGVQLVGNTMYIVL